MFFKSFQPTFHTKRGVMKMSQNKYFLVKTHPFYVLLLGKERAKIIGNKWIVSIFLFVVFGLCSFCSSLTSAPFVGRLTTVATEKYNKLFSIWRLQYTFSTNIIGKYWEILKNITNRLPSEDCNWRNSQSLEDGKSEWKSETVSHEWAMG